MTRIHIHSPDGTVAEQPPLASGESLVIGREPDVAALADAEGAPAPTRWLSVASSLVSSNHVMLWLEDGALRARDLHSKNGTYLRLDRGADVALHGAREAHFFLAAPQPSARSLAPRPVDAACPSAEQFAEQLRGAVAAWLAQAGHSPRLRVVAPGGEGAGLPSDGDGHFGVPLVEGLVLEISDDDIGRTQARWDGLKEELYPYAYEQVAAWRALRAARTGRPLAFHAPSAQRALREVLDAARAGLPLVLSGESGTGKTELAAIYAGRESMRAARTRASGDAGDPPFVTVHCAHLDPPLAHSQLFGALRGSYTSSDRTVEGAVERADGGVLFLDDVDALPAETQAKLLRFLDQGLYEPLGHDRRHPLRANVRVVAGSNLDLRAAVRQGRFREDLYWRLHTGAVVRVPPLRERPEDIEQLLRGAPGTPSHDEGQARPGSPRGHGRSVADRLDPGALELLLHRHGWRGNFRECIRFCARVRMEPASRPVLDRRRCEEILAEATLDAEPTTRPAVSSGGGRVEDDGAFERSLRDAITRFRETEGQAPESFDELQRFCEVYLKSTFVAHALGLEAAEERPDAFDREGRKRLGCDLSTLKRKVDDYLALRAGTGAPPRPRPGDVKR